jgi:hypothetical protein
MRIAFGKPHYGPLDPVGKKQVALSDLQNLLGKPVGRQANGAGGMASMKVFGVGGVDMDREQKPGPEKNRRRERPDFPHGPFVLNARLAVNRN